MAFVNISSRTHTIETYQHWCPKSESYTGADSLMSALDSGWLVDDTVYKQVHELGAGRIVNIFHVRLRRGDEARTMRVSGNPFILRFFAIHGIQVLTRTDSPKIAHFIA